MHNKIAISQSLIKAFGYDESFCPKQIYEIYINKSVKSIASEAMKKGSYFEYLALGSGAGKDEDVKDLPRLKSGEKSVQQQRIEANAVQFAEICKERPIIIKEKQVKLTLDYSKEYTLEGTIDFFGMIDDKPDLAIFDLKLTGSLYHEKQQGGFGNWSWEFPYNMNFLQAYFYHYLAQETFGKSMDFYYLVWDYKPFSEYKIILKKIERMHIMELMESIRKTIERIEFYKSTGWEYNANYKNCMNCPLKNECPERVLQKPVTTI